MNPKKLIRDLYVTVDARNIDQLSDFLDEEVRFCLGNGSPLQGKADVLAANQQFFSSIHSMRHSLDQIWEAGDWVLCDGAVTYTRLDGSQTEARFATALRLAAAKVVDYRVYVDISHL